MTTFSPSISARMEASSPTRKSSITTRLPASPKALPPKSADEKPTPLLKATGDFHVYDKKVDACRANPVICDGRLYTRVDQQIYCFDIKAK